MTVSPERAPNKPLEVEIEYEAGNPVAVDGKKMSPATLLAHLNSWAGHMGSDVSIWSRTATSA